MRVSKALGWAHTPQGAVTITRERGSVKVPRPAVWGQASFWGRTGPAPHPTPHRGLLAGLQTPGRDSLFPRALGCGAEFSGC